MSGPATERAVAFASAAETITTSMCIAATLIAVVWAGYAWMDGMGERNKALELARHETCYEDWWYNAATQTNTLRVAYCGTKHGGTD